MCFCHRCPKKNFSPFCSASPEIIGVKFCNFNKPKKYDLREGAGARRLVHVQHTSVVYEEKELQKCKWHFPNTCKAIDANGAFNGMQSYWVDCLKT